MGMGKKMAAIYKRQLLAAYLLRGGAVGMVLSAMGSFITPIMYVTGQGQGVVAAVLAVGSIASMVLMMFAGRIVQKMPLRPLLLGGSIGGMLCFIACGYVSQIWEFGILLSLCTVATAIPAFVVAPMLITNWFEEKKGLFAGLMTTFAQIFAVISAPIAGYLLGAEPYDLRTACTVMGCAGLVAMSIGSMLAVAHPSMVGLRAYGASAPAAPDAPSSPAPSTPKAEAIAGIPTERALHSSAFYCLFIVVLLMISIGSFSQLLPNMIVVGYGRSNQEASTVLSAFCAGSAIGGFLTGGLDDKFGVQKTTLAFLGIGLCGMVGLTFLGSIGLGVLMLSAFMLGLEGAASGVQEQMLVSQSFGQRSFAVVFSRMNIAQYAGALATTILVGGIAQATGSYTPAMLMLMSFALAAAVLVIVLRRLAAGLWAEAGQEPPRF